MVKVRREGNTIFIMSKKEVAERERILLGELRSCPSCEQALELQQRMCKTCGTLINLTDGTVDLNSQATFSEMQEFIQAQAKSSKLGKWVMLGGILLVPLGFLINGILGIAIFIVGVVIALLGWVHRSDSASKIKSQAATNIMPMLLKKIFKEFDYQHEKGLAVEDIQQAANSFGFRFDELRGSDLVKGNYRGVRCAFSDIELTQVTTSKDSEGNTVHTYKEAFKGLWLICDFPKQLVADVSVQERERKGQRNLKGGITTDSASFTKRFFVESINEQQAYYILTPHMMEYIQRMADRAQAKVFLHFQKEGQVHVAIYSQHNSFEIADAEMMNLGKVMQQFSEEIDYIVSLIDELRLVDSLSFSPQGE